MRRHHSASLVALLVLGSWAEVDLAGSVTFDTSDSEVPGLDATVTVDYQIHQRNKDKWNYLVGFNWDVRKFFSLHAEAGFGGSRQNFVSGGPIACFRRQVVRYPG